MISASEDGSIYLSSIKEWVNGVDAALAEPGENNNKAAKVYLMNNYSLVSKTGNDAKKELIKELEYKILNLKSDIEDEKDKDIEEYNRQIKSLEKDNEEEFMGL